jgi:hypothetical protein
MIKDSEKARIHIGKPSALQASPRLCGEKITSKLIQGRNRLSTVDWRSETIDISRAYARMNPLDGAFVTQE